MPVEIRVPAMGESVVEATIAQWLKAPGDSVKAGEDLVELETDKVNQVIQAESDGTLTEIRSNAGDTVAVGDVLGVVGEAGANGTAPAATAPVASATQPAPASTSPATPPATPTNGAGNATPVASRMAAENNVDLNAIKDPTGPAGKIGKQDVTSQISATQPATAVQKQQEKAAPVVKPATSSAPSTSSGRPEERIPMTKRRKVIAQRLVSTLR